MFMYVCVLYTCIKNILCSFVVLAYVYIRRCYVYRIRQNACPAGRGRGGEASRRV